MIKKIKKHKSVYNNSNVEFVQRQANEVARRLVRWRHVLLVKGSCPFFVA
jgi:hypothetical protein